MSGVLLKDTKRDLVIVGRKQKKPSDLGGSHAAAFGNSAIFKTALRPDA
jgi:hypothetical protein